MTTNADHPAKSAKLAYARAQFEEEAAALATAAIGGANLSEPRDATLGVLCDTTPLRKAAELKKPPAKIAEEAAAKINHTHKALVGEAVAVNGYVNFMPSNKYCSLAVTQAIEMASSYGGSTEGKGKKFIIDYSDPNVGKPFHVGHIRSTILGAAILAAKRAAGYDATGYTWLGDSGTQVAKLIVALDEFKDMPKAVDEKGLLEYYKKIHAEFESHPELAEKARKTQDLLEQGDEATVKKAQKIREISLRGFEKNWARLGVAFDLVTGESTFIKPARSAVEELIEKKIAFIDPKGKETVIGLEKHGLPNTIIARSDGTTLYLTRDIAREDWAYKKWHYDESLVITASEQNTHFKQLHKVAELLGRPYAGHLSHVGFGLVFLESGKISSREGRVVFLDDVIDGAVGSALEEITKRDLGYTDKQARDIASKVGIGALKFSVLRVGAEKNITFDPGKAVSFEGDTSAHIQYTIVRAGNILAKAGVAKPESLKLQNDSAFDAVESQLASLIADFPAVVHKAQANYQVHALCDYCVKLSSKFSEFYEKNPVLKADSDEEKHKRLCLTYATKVTLSNALTLLGIGIPEKM